MIKSILFSRINLIKIYFLFNLLKTNLFQEQNQNKIIKTIDRASKKGYNLSNPNDDFFLDICIEYSYNEKDVTLDYRRKYFFFPEKKNKKVVFLHPKRNNTNSCFISHFQLKNFFKNVAFCFIFPLFLFQISLLLVVILINRDKLFYNTSIKKLEVLTKFRCLFCHKKNVVDKKKEIKNYCEFIGESSDGMKVSKISYNVNNDTELNMIVQKNNLIDNKEKDTDIEENSRKNLDSQKIMNKSIKYSISNTIDVMEPKSNIQQSNCTAQFNIKAVDMIEDKESGKRKKNEESDIENEVNIKNKKIVNLSEEEEDNIDNYSFGMGNKYPLEIGKINFDGKKSTSKRNDNNSNKKEDKLKNIQIIYNTLNKEKKYNNNKKSNFVPTYLNSKIKKTTKFIYDSEEYFYFGYLLARIEDKRSVTSIYYDLLEQCQFIFKFFCTPFNIYEDYRVQLVYYSLKIDLYFYFNCILISNNIINGIYDGRNHFINDLYRSLIACIFTFFISIFLYKIPNIKKMLIARSYKLSNLGILEQRISIELSKLTYKMAMDTLFGKLIGFFFISIFISCYSFYVCYSFCAIYIYTQLYILKGVLFSIIISLISPFIFCWIPSYVRKKAITEKCEKLYRLAKYIEFLFVG